MALDPVALTTIVVAVGGVAAGYIVPLVLARRNAAGDEKRDAVSSWAQLNDALQEEIKRVTGELALQRADFQRQFEAARADYQGQLDASRKRITELEAEVAALQRALRGAQP